jgi:hypothetical protein
MARVLLDLLMEQVEHTNPDHLHLEVEVEVETPHSVLGLQVELELRYLIRCQIIVLLQ